MTNKRAIHKPTHLSLFSGIGGIDLAAEWAGFETIGQCEWADYPSKVLEKHWPDVPRWRDIKTLTQESFYEKTNLRTVDFISGGFPCQPFSVAGKQEGEDDDRFLWPEMVRVIREIKPKWVLGENVVGLLDMGIGTVLSDLERIGYSGGVFQIPACAVGASHVRNRLFISAYAVGIRWDGLDKKQKEESKRVGNENFEQRWHLEGDIPLDFKKALTDASGGFERNDDGLSPGVDRLKCLGNAVVPQQVYPILQGIAEILEDTK